MRKALNAKLTEGATVVTQFPEDQEIACTNERGKKKTWEFDATFQMDSTQEEVYSQVSPLVTSMMDGFNVCIFAYGQTGSGKTFTMAGPPDNRGVNTRALDELFKRRDERAAAR